MTESEFSGGWLGGRESSKLVHITGQYCKGRGVDFGCELDPHPAATILVDNGQIVHDKLHNQPHPSGATYEVHIRNIEALFPDWQSDSLDFAYSSHLLEHVLDPKAFLTECIRIVKPGGHVVVVHPHSDWYWPTTHPLANPDHTKYNWSLTQDKVSKWLKACGKVEIVHSSEHGWDEDNWSGVVIAKKL
jgi:SAM-dependent methyltransferase